MDQKALVGFQKLNGKDFAGRDMVKLINGPQKVGQ